MLKRCNLVCRLSFMLVVFVGSVLKLQAATLADLGPIDRIGGGSIDLLNSEANKPVYLKFWASWCKPCIKEMPHLQEAYVSFGDQVQFVAVNINVNETPEEVEKVIQQYGLTLPVALDTNGRLANLLEFVGTPYHVLFDAQGHLVHQGHEHSSKLDRKLSILAKKQTGVLPRLVLDSGDEQTPLDLNEQSGLRAMLFTATFCDWYLADTRPTMSQACIDGQLQANELAKYSEAVNWSVIVSHLWTGESDLREYKRKFSVEMPGYIDSTGDAFFSFAIRRYPTLIVTHDGKEIARSSDVTSFQQVIKNAETHVK